MYQGVRHGNLLSVIPVQWDTSRLPFNSTHIERFVPKSQEQNPLPIQFHLMPISQLSTHLFRTQTAHKVRLMWGGRGIILSPS